MNRNKNKITPTQRRRLLDAVGKALAEQEWRATADAECLEIDAARGLPMNNLEKARCKQYRAKARSLLSAQDFIEKNGAIPRRQADLVRAALTKTLLMIADNLDGWHDPEAWTIWRTDCREARRKLRFLVPAPAQRRGKT